MLYIGKGTIFEGCTFRSNIGQPPYDKLTNYIS